MTDLCDNKQKLAFVLEMGKVERSKSKNRVPEWIMLTMVCIHVYMGILKDLPSNVFLQWTLTQQLNQIVDAHSLPDVPIS